MNSSLKLITVIVFLIVSLNPGATRAGFDVLETKHLRLIYTEGMHSFLAPYVARCFENAYKFHSELWDYDSHEKITVFLFDITDYGNAGAGIVPWNKIVILIAPSSYVYETMPANERMNATMNHELVHIVAFDKSTGSDNFFRGLFGGKVRASADNPLSIFYSYLTAPRISAPRWYHEGIAVFMETWMAGGLGRTLGAYDEMVFRTMVLENARFYDPVGLESEGTKVDFQLGVNSYLYGTRFMSYLALQFGPEQLIAWVGRSSGSKSHYGRQFKKVYGLSLDECWSHWITWEKDFQNKNLTFVSEYPVTQTRPIANRPLGSVSQPFYDDSAGCIYVGVNYPGKVAYLARIDIATGRMKHIIDVKGAALYFVTSLTFDPDSRTLFYTTDNNDWRDLRSINVESGASQTLQEDVRLGDLAFNRADRSIWGVRHFNGISTLTRIAYPYDDWDQIYSLPYGKDLYDIDISPDGKLLTGALAEISGRQKLVSAKIDSLMSGDTTLTTIFDFGLSLPANFTFTPDGRYLYGSSYYSGVSNIFRYDFSRDSMEAVTNAITGLFRPVQYSEDSLIAFEYTSQGFLPVMLADSVIEDINAIDFLGQKVVENHPLVKDWLVPPPSSVALDSLITYKGKYHPLSQVRLSSIFPIVEGYKHYTSVGLRMGFEEPVGFHAADLKVSYTPSKVLPTDERWHTTFNYNYLDWKLNFQYNGTDFYDLFGPTKSSRKGYSASLQYSRMLIYDTPRKLDYTIGISSYWDLERLPDYQNVATTFDKFVTYNAALSYRNMRASFGAVDYEKGIKWRLAGNGSFVSDKLYPHYSANLDLGITLPIPHSSFWLRTYAGYADGDRSEPFANFFFGGFGNNWVDYQSVQRYRQSYAFPGIGLNDAAGTNYLKLLGEWTLPPLRFRRLGVASFYVTWVRTAIFGSGLLTNFDSRPDQRRLGNAGIQSDIRMTLLSQYRITFSVGYAFAFEKNFRPTDELMISVKIL